MLLHITLVYAAYNTDRRANHPFSPQYVPQELRSAVGQLRMSMQECHSCWSSMGITHRLSLGMLRICALHLWLGNVLAAHPVLGPIISDTPTEKGHHMANLLLTSHICTIPGCHLLDQAHNIDFVDLSSYSLLLDGITPPPMSM